jgi:hypothetical protein
MKKFATIFMAIMLVAGVSYTVKAQIGIGANAGLAMPMGSFGDAYNMGFGGSAYGQYTLNDQMTIGLNIGYYSFSGKNVPSGSDISWSYMPVVADFKYMLSSEKFMPYVGLGLGLYSASSKVEIMGISASASESKFGFAPMVGFWMGDDFKWGANLSYNAVSDASYLGINIGIVYPLGK